MTKETLVISGFPGIGKKESIATFSKMFSIIDLSPYSFSPVRDHAERIKAAMDTHEIILVSTHYAIRNAMAENKIPYILVYPDVNLRTEYVGRFYIKGEDNKTISNLADNWYTWVSNCETDTTAKKKIVLGSTEVIDKVIHEETLLWNIGRV